MRVYRAGWVVPVEGTPLRDGAVAVQDGRIAAVGPLRAIAARRGEADLHDLGPGVLMPGLVNAHCHLELSHLAGRIAGDGFVDWVERLVQARFADTSDPRPATAAAIDEVVRTGTVAIGDVSNRLDHIALLGASPLHAVVFHELLTWDPAMADRALEQARAREATVGGARPFPNVEIRLAAHAPHSVSPALFAALVAEGGPAALHLAESPQEAQFLASGSGEWAAFLQRRGLGHVTFTPPRTSPVQYVERLGVLRPGLVAAHCVQAGPADLRLLARRGVFVAVCPRSNRILDVGRAPVPEMMKAGVRACLGTDSLASADSLDLMDDLVLLHREFPGLDPARLVRMATAEGAAALGLADLGTLSAGRAAAMAFAEGPREMADPAAFLVSGDARLRPVAA